MDYEAVLDKKFIGAHVWVCDVERVMAACKKENQAYIVGMPENIDELMNQVDKIILLECLPQIFIERILKRTDNDFGKEASAQKEILGMYEKFNKRIVKRGAIVVDTEEDIDSVVEKIIRSTT